MESLSQWIENWLTRIYARLGFGRVVEISEYSVSGITEQVYWIESDANRAGHCTPFNTILLNKKPLRSLSEEAVDYVFLHEIGHTQPAFILRILFYILAVPAMFMALLSPFAGLWQTVIALQTGSLYLTSLTVVAGLIAVSLVTFPVVLLSWIDEGYADLFALNRIGEEKYLRSSKEISEVSDRGWLKGLFHRLRYPPPRLIIWFSEKF